MATAGNRLAIMQPGSWRTDKQTSTQRGYGYKWQKAREGYLSSHPLCVYCEREGRTTAATVVDHITPHRGDMARFWDETNWQSLCATHHSSQKQREEAQG
jgi:5-methylcytosine-specific restriction endonuclease McrA